MFSQIPSLSQVLASAQRSCHYEIEVGPTGNFRLSSTDPEDHGRAMEALKLYQSANARTQSATPTQPAPTPVKAPTAPKKKEDQPIEAVPSKVTVTPPHLATIACILFDIAINFQPERFDG